MKSLRIIRYAAAAAAALALTVVLAASASASTRTVAYGTGAGGTLNMGYAHPKVKPASWWWGADGGRSVRGITWGSWGHDEAHGRGTRWLNTCIPYCYNGHYKKAPATLTLWRVRLHKGQPFFTRLTVGWNNRSGHHKHVYSWGSLHAGSMPFWR